LYSERQQSDDSGYAKKITSPHDLSYPGAADPSVSDFSTASKVEQSVLGQSHQFVPPLTTSVLNCEHHALEQPLPQVPTSDMALLFDFFVGTCEHCGSNVEAEGLCRRGLWRTRIL
jgi:hypothetical protein